MLRVLLVGFSLIFVTSSQYYRIDDKEGVGPTFDGIGGLSGGGATSRLLPSYDNASADMILDILFKPNFAASLQILKVEIGGDGQSTDGTESSHMHSENDENYQRGYEWWLMTEAKKRNPNIKLYGLPWAFPGWLGNGTNSPYKYPEITAGYIVKWIQGAKTTYQLDIDYVGIWNERPFDATYIKTLRKALDAASLQNVQIVAADGSFGGIVSAVLDDSELLNAISVIGAHYPGTISPSNALSIKKALWASEDYSTYNDDVGAGCWARILNQNYVNGHMTSTISWNLIASYYDGLPYFRDGLMTAIEPWSGNFEINGPIYITAHTTQFTKPGDVYMLNGLGSGFLAKGGSYVSIMDPQTKDLTIIIETMTHNHSLCIRPPLPEYEVSPQQITFVLQGSFDKITKLYRWDSQLFNTSNNTAQYFIKNGTVKVEDGLIMLDVPVDHVMTLSTKTGQTKGTYTPPPSKPFPIPLEDNFESYSLSSEANYFADQYGVYEIRTSLYNKSEKVMTQVVPSHVISWCGDANETITLIGQNNWESITVGVEVILPDIHDIIPSVGAFIAARVSGGGCGTSSASGIFFWINTSGHWSVTEDLAGKKVIETKTLDVPPGKKHLLEMDVEGTTASFAVNGVVLASQISVGTGAGFVGFGTSGYFPAEFDNFVLAKAA